jgi:murein DD-endopeptidase MepM/ murein hydrolase activator NlpD
MQTGGAPLAGESSTSGGERDDGSNGGKSSGGKGSPDGGARASGGSSANGGASQRSGGRDGSGGEESGSGGSESCDEESCSFEWPLRGTPTEDWVIANYVDREPGAGLLDYEGGVRTYEGHQGVDIAIASFRVMDQGVPVHAVAPGFVTQVHDGEADRNTVNDPGNCNLVGNSVKVTHPDGREALYLHFRKNSILVEEGDQIQVGEELGLVGSSGCSESPHLHFELRDGPGGEVIDPFFDGLWVESPDYDAGPGFMEVVLVPGGIGSTTDVQTAPPSPSVNAEYTFGISVITGGTKVGEVEQINFYQNDILRVYLEPYTFDGSERHYMRWWNVSLTSGLWRAEVELGGEVVGSLNFEQQ